MNNKDVSIYADYNNWFSKDAWTLEQAAVLMIGLNPDVVLDQELHQQYEDYQAGHDIQITENMYRLERYSEKFWDWREAISDAVPRFYDFYCASELDDLVETFPYVGNYEGYKDATVIPMDIIQWCVSCLTQGAQSIFRRMRGRAHCRCSPPRMGTLGGETPSSTQGTSGSSK